MANIKATKAGNHNDTTVWDGGVVPGVGDTAYTNTFAIAIVADWTVDAISTRAATGITQGGYCTISDGVVITADLYGFTNQSFRYTGTGESSIVGTVYGSTAQNAYTLSHQGTGTLSATTVIGGSGINARCVYAYGAGQFNCTNSYASSTAVGILANMLVSITNCYGADTGEQLGCLTQTLTTTVTNAYGGAWLHAVGIRYESPSSGYVENAYYGEALMIYPSWGVYSFSAISPCVVKNIIWTDPWISPVGGYIVLDSDAPSIVGIDEDGDAITLVSASSLSPTWYPAVADVRKDTVYANGGLTGTCNVPAASSVSSGVPVDATVGTAIITNSNLLDVVGPLFESYMR